MQPTAAPSPPAAGSAAKPTGPGAPDLACPDLRRLCDRCLGRRVVGAIGADGQRAKAREARAAETDAGRAWPEVAERDCPVCEGAFLDAAKWVEAAAAAMAPFESATFQVGTQFPTSCEALEKEISKAARQEKVGETIRTEANRWLSAAIAKATGKAPVPDGRPDLKVQVDCRYWTADVEPAAVYVWGRYNKLRRDIPQTHWPCRRCTGKGCWQCDDTGVTYAESVEDAIGEPAQPLFGATGFSFHGAGREDIDALMLGSGRPFILELHAPRRRTADLRELERRVNTTTATSGVAIRDLRAAQKDEVAAIKEGEYDKQYLAHCLAERPLTPAEVEEVAAKLTGTTLEQRTPDRVSHRRADLVRKRRLHEVKPEPMAGPSERFDLKVLAESGTYIKEMVSGDEGRTVPSFTSLSGVQVKVEFLDVVAILDHLPKIKAEPGAP